MTAPPLLDIVAMKAWYGKAQIVFDLSLSVRRGEAVALIGRNGAGKSTTMKAIMGLVRREARHIAFDGVSLARLPTYEIARNGVGYVPEDRRIFTDLTVAENLDIGRRTPAAATMQVPTWSDEEIFTLFPNLASMRHRLGGQMSGGEQQMLSIARTLVGNPALVLLDEPTEGVAPVIVEQMIQALGMLKRRGLSLLVSEQNHELCSTLCDRAYIIEHGTESWSGPMGTLVENRVIQDIVDD